MKPLIQVLLLFLVYCFYGCTSETPESGQSDWLNVLFIVSDDLRTELGAYGYPHMYTPNIDKFASEGRLFVQAHVQEAICNPSRMSFLTGLRPDEIKVYSNRDHFRARVPNATTIPQHFKENGYRTQCIGKIFHGGMDDPFAWSMEPTKFSHPKYGPETQAEADSAKEALRERGLLQVRYLEVDSATGLPIRQIREKGVEFHSISWEAPEVDPFYLGDGRNCEYALKTLDTLADTAEPFFLAVGFSRPHTPYVAPARFFAYYDLDTLDDKTRHAPVHAPEWAFPGARELAEYSDIRSDQIPLPKQRELRRAYRACVSYVDFLIGELLNKLAATGLEKNTVVILMGDHGYHLGEQSIWTKQTNFDWGTRAPLILRIPDQRLPGRSSDTFVEFIDLLPTISELAKLPVPSPVSGKSFAQVVHDDRKTHKTYAFSQYPRKRDEIKAMGYTVRKKDWRYTVWLNRKSGDILAEELYDLSQGDYEKINLIKENAHREELTELREVLESNLNISITNQ